MLHTDEHTDSCPEDVVAVIPPTCVTVTKQTSIHMTSSMDGIPKSSVAVSSTALIAGVVAAGIVVVGLALVIIVLVALFVQQNKHKVHSANSRDVTYPNPIYESKQLRRVMKMDCILSLMF